MPQTSVIFYCEQDGTSPVLAWLEELRARNPKAWANCRVRIEQLQQAGHELRRPAADLLRDGVYELRARQGHVQYRILYFYHGRNIAVLAHSLTKEDRVPSVDIDRALGRKQLFVARPKVHTYEEESE